MSYHIGKAINQNYQSLTLQKAHSKNVHCASIISLLVSQFRNKMVLWWLVKQFIVYERLAYWNIQSHWSIIHSLHLYSFDSICMKCQQTKIKRPNQYKYFKIKLWTTFNSLVTYLLLTLLCTILSTIILLAQSWRKSCNL